MGLTGVVTSTARSLAIVCIAVSSVDAGSVTLSNGVSGAGFTSLTPDDYGTYGFLIGQQYDDEYAPVGTSNTFTPTYLTGPMLFVTPAGGTRSSVLLTDYKPWHDFVENPPPTPDGISGALVRTPLGISATGNEATSSFRVADTGAGVLLDFDLVQRLTSDATTRTSQVDQIYTIKNNGTVATQIVFVLMWDSDMYYNGSNQDFDDVVGISAARCGVHQHDGDPRWSIGLGNGPLSTVPMASYFAGKEDFVPGAGPAFSPVSAADDKQYIWLGGGIPDGWRGYVVGPGTTGAGDSGTEVGDATLGIEYRFSIAPAATETLHIRRYYGTTTIPCFVSPKCGNGVLDSGELCDGTDTAACNGTSCTASACGDGYRNTLAGEACDTGGADAVDCNAGTCAMPACGDGYANAAANELCDHGGDSAACDVDCTPATCGDGYVNSAAAEECEGGELCDPSTCLVTFTVGGGCGGCGTAGDGRATLLLAAIIVATRRRRRARGA